MLENKSSKNIKCSGYFLQCYLSDSIDVDIMHNLKISEEMMNDRLRFIL